MKKDGCIQRWTCSFRRPGPGQPDLLTIQGSGASDKLISLSMTNLCHLLFLTLFHPTQRGFYYLKSWNCPREATLAVLGTYLADCAVNGYNVVRLKGGDLYFCRLREEIEPLVEHSVSFEIILGLHQQPQQQRQQSPR